MVPRPHMSITTMPNQFLPLTTEHRASFVTRLLQRSYEQHGRRDTYARTRDMYRLVHWHTSAQRDEMLHRLALNPSLQAQLWLMYDLYDEESHFKDQIRVFETLAQQAAARQNLVDSQLQGAILSLITTNRDQLIFQATRLPPDTALAVAPASPEPDNALPSPVVAQPAVPDLPRSPSPYLPQTPPSPRSPGSHPDQPIDLALTPPPGLAPRPRRPLNSSGSEVDDQGAVFHRDGHPCTSMFAHGPDYATDSGVEAPLRDEEQRAQASHDDALNRAVWREAIEGYGDSDFSIHKD